MALEIAIRSLIVNDATVNAVVSGRVYPWTHQQGADFPLIVYTLDGTEPTQGMNGHLDLTRAVLTVESIAETYSAAKDLAGKVRSVLNDYSGTSETVVIKSLVHDNDTASIDGSMASGDRGVSVIEAEYIIWYETS
jgi:hypothetical protein